MNFAETAYLKLLWLTPILIFFYILSFKKKDKLISVFISKEVKDRLIPKRTRIRQKIKAFLIILSIVFIVIALSRPRWSFVWNDIKRKGVDIIIAVDVSESMLAEDVLPNRLERAKREITDLLNMLEGDRVGLVAFSGTSFVHCPLTLDYSSVAIFIDYLDTNLMPVSGTAIEEALNTSIEALDKTGKSNSKAIILITDGEDHEGSPVAAAKIAKEKGIKIFSIGIGKMGGAPIPNSNGGFKKNKNGEVIITKLDEETLQNIAIETEGSYVRSVTGDLDLEQIYLKDIKENMEKKEFKSKRRKMWEERFFIFVFLGLVCLLLDLMINERNS